MKKNIIIGSCVVLFFFGILYLYSLHTDKAIFLGNESNWSARLEFIKQGKNVRELFTLQYNGDFPEQVETVFCQYQLSYGSYRTINGKLDDNTKQITLSSGGIYNIPDKNTMVKVIVRWNKGQQVLYLRQ